MSTKNKEQINMTFDKSTYLEDQDVNDFIVYFSNLINGTQTFSHENETRNPIQSFRFCSIEDAATQYFFGMNLASTNSKLKLIAENLQASINNGNEFDTLKHCTEILEWGGVTSGAYGILRLYLSGSLISSIKGAYTEMQKPIVSFHDFTGAIPRYQMNSSFTKIYALASPHPFIIFDSRVSAALQLIVTNFSNSTRLNGSIPSCLAFPQLESRGGDNAPNRRLPGFPGFAQNRARHAEWNVKANLIIEAALNQAHASGLTTFAEATEHLDQMRAVEAALFMIGYEV